MTNLTERARELRERLVNIAAPPIWGAQAIDHLGQEKALRDLADLVCELAEAVRRLEGTEVWK